MINKQKASFNISKRDILMEVSIYILQQKKIRNFVFFVFTKNNIKKYTNFYGLMF